MKLVNLTTHSVTITTEAGTVIVPPSGRIAKARMIRAAEQPIEVDGVSIPIHTIEFERVVGLPPEKPDTLCIVSLVVAQAKLSGAEGVAGRNDLVLIDEPIRDPSSGVIVCATSLSRV